MSKVSFQLRKKFAGRSAFKISCYIFSYGQARLLIISLKIRLRGYNYHDKLTSVPKHVSVKRQRCMALINTVA